MDLAPTHRFEQTKPAESRKDPVWLAAAVSLGWAYLVSHLILVMNLVEWYRLGPPWQRSGGRPSRAEATIGALIVMSALMVLVLGALRWSGHRPRSWITLVLSGCLVALAGVAGAAAAFLLLLIPLPFAAWIVSVAVMLTWAAVGAIPARICLHIRPTTKRGSFARLTCTAMSSAVALAIGFYLLNHVFANEMMKYAFGEGFFYASLPLVGCVGGCYAGAALARFIDRCHRAAQERA